MIKLWKQIPRKWKITLDCAAVLLLVFMLWAAWDYPMPTANMAFRRTLSRAGLPARDPELILELKSDYISDYIISDRESVKTTDWTLGLLAEGDRVLQVSLSKELGWDASKPLQVFAAEGVYYTPLPCWGDKFEHSKFGNSRKFHDAARQKDSGVRSPVDIRIPAFAVKAPGADASLTLILRSDEEYGSTDWSEARFPLLLQEQEKGWFIFRWDSLDIIDHVYRETVGGTTYDRYTEECYHILDDWLYEYNISMEDSCRFANARLELITRDEAGNVLEQVSWELP